MRAELEAKVDCEESLLIEAAIAGNAQAFASLYDLHLERVYRYVYYWVGKKADAEDLTQQVFLNAWRSISAYQRTGASFVAWLLRIAHNTVVSFFRRAKEVYLLDYEPQCNDRYANPEGALLMAHDRQAVRRAILRLKPDQQQVIVMRFLEHFDYQDIAAALGKSEGNVRVIQHRALVELRRMLAHEVNAR